MSLEQWLRNGHLRPHDATLGEIQRLLQVVDRDLADAQTPGLSVDGRFMHAYDAALQLCIVPLLASGYRVQKGQGHHKYGILSLRYTLGDRWSETADHIEMCSRLRGKAVYERTGVVNDEGARELLIVSQRLRSDVIDWLRAEHPAVLPPGV
jgi:hypothetical protein